MGLILNIETSTKNCSVSLAEKGRTISCIEITEQNFSHAEKLHVFIEQILKENHCNFKHLQAVAVSRGPGSYTGLRIGVSAAKGLAYALNIPLIAIDTLVILAHSLSVAKGHIVPMIDARRMEVYCAVLNPDYTIFRDIKAEVIDENSFSEIKTDLHLVGDGIQKLKEVLVDKKFIFHDAITYPSAKEMSILSYKKFEDKHFEDVAYFEPFYLKDFLSHKN
ncbi:MAG TPA: tRNA (adenosine(37)-N6)-threonylcarbamoyltransferase complex dimerization subunit type 1 TsaB [Flavobacterium sp.]|nr:tRNA (adenosine(37)-N6)-threonylcarbamoyltransferase complex dimerization subunit type 1 TsaB [Flavobacterium sp.]